MSIVSSQSDKNDTSNQEERGIKEPIPSNSQIIPQNDTTILAVERCPFCNATKVRKEAKFCDMCGHALTLGVSSSEKEDVDYLIAEAHTFYTLKRLDGAIALYNRALKTNATNPLGWQ